jgi:hypothetical protein
MTGLPRRLRGAPRVPRKNAKDAKSVCLAIWRVLLAVLQDVHSEPSQIGAKTALAAARVPAGSKRIKGIKKTIFQNVVPLRSLLVSLAGRSR